MSELDKLKRLAQLARQTGDQQLELQALKKIKSLDRKQTKPNFGVNLVRQINEGLLLGYGDEVEAALQSIPELMKGGTVSDTYEQHLRSIRDKREAFSEANPGTSMAAEFAGGIVAPGMAGAKLASKLPQAGMAMKGALTAAPAAAVAGSGAADPDEELNFKESISERMAGALKGATAGAVLGAVTPKVADFIGGGTKKLASGVRETFKGAETKALRKLSEAMERDSVSMTNMLRKKAILGPEATLADLGDSNISDLLETIAQQPGTARNKVQKALTGRLMKQRERLKDVVRNNIHPQSENLDAAKEAIQQEMRIQARPLYEAALSHEIDMTPGIKKILDTPYVKPLLKTAVNKVKSDLDLPETMKIGLNPDMPNMALLDAVGKSLRDKQIKAGSGTDKARMYKNLRSGLLGELDKQADSYGAARKVWADGAQQVEALELGQRIFKDAKKAPASIKKQFDEMSLTEQQMFRLGAGNEMIREIMTAPDTLEGRPAASIISKIFSSQAQKEAVEAIVEDPKNYRQFKRALNAERIFIQQSNKALSNSATARRLAAEADNQLAVNAAADIAQGRLGGIFNVLSRMSKGSGMNEASRKEIAQMLTQQNIKDIKATLIAANRVGSILPKPLENALKLENSKMFKYIERNPDTVFKALSKAAGIMGAVEVQ